MLGQIMLIEEVFYPMGEAIQMAAEQNVRRDFNLHLISVEKFDDLEMADQMHYRAMAYDVLCKLGKNYVPNYPDHERICVAPEKVYYPLNQAVLAYANQLIEVDVANGTIANAEQMGVPPKVIAQYLRQARQYLEEHGEAPTPVYPNKHIHVQKDSDV